MSITGSVFFLMYSLITSIPRKKLAASIRLFWLLITLTVYLIPFPLFKYLFLPILWDSHWSGVVNSYFFTEKGQYDDFFGGQNLADYFINEIAITTQGQVQTKHQSNVNTALMNVATQMTGNPAMTAEEAMEAFKTEVQTLIPNATIK